MAGKVQTGAVPTPQPTGNNSLGPLSPEMSALASQLIKSGALKTLLDDHPPTPSPGPVRRVAVPAGSPSPGAPAVSTHVPVHPPPFETKPQSKKAEIAEPAPHPQLAESKSLPMLQQIALELKRAQLSSV